MLVCILPIRAANSVSFTPAQAARLVSFPIWALASLVCICAILYPEPEELLGCLMLAGPQQEDQQEQLAGHHAIKCFNVCLPLLASVRLDYAALWPVVYLWSRLTS